MFWTHFAFSMSPPERAREGRLGASSRTISSTCIDFRKCYKNQWILNDFVPADHPDRSRRPFLAKSKIALPLRKYPHFRSSTSDFHHVIGCHLRGGSSRPPPSDRTPKSAQNRSHLTCQPDPLGGKFEAEEDASQGVDKHRLMRACDAHVYCDNAVADIATKLHHLSILIRTGIGGNHTMGQPHNSRVRRCFAKRLK